MINGVCMFMAGGGQNIQEELTDFFGTGSDEALKMDIRCRLKSIFVK